MVTVVIFIGFTSLVIAQILLGKMPLSPPWWPKNEGNTFPIFCHRKCLFPFYTFKKFFQWKSMFPCSLKVILRYTLFPKSKWSCSLVPKNPWEALITGTAGATYITSWPSEVKYCLLLLYVRDVVKNSEELALVVRTRRYVPAAEVTFSDM